MKSPVVLVLPNGDFLHHGNNLAIRIFVSLCQKVCFHFDNVVLLFKQPLLQVFNFYVKVQGSVVIAAIAMAPAPLKQNTIHFNISYLITF
jgi:hypothetical protein